MAVHLDPKQGTQEKENGGRNGHKSKRCHEKEFCLVLPLLGTVDLKTFGPDFKRRELRAGLMFCLLLLTLWLLHLDIPHKACVRERWGV